MGGGFWELAPGLSVKQFLHDSYQDAMRVVVVCVVLSMALCRRLVKRVCYTVIHHSLVPSTLPCFEQLLVVPTVPQCCCAFSSPSESSLDGSERLASCPKPNTKTALCVRTAHFLLSSRKNSL